LEADEIPCKDGAFRVLNRGRVPNAVAESGNEEITSADAVLAKFCCVKVAIGNR
jgi:hypothetical protein